MVIILLLINLSYRKIKSTHKITLMKNQENFQTLWEALGLNTYLALPKFRKRSSLITIAAKPKVFLTPMI